MLALEEEGIMLGTQLMKERKSFTPNFKNYKNVKNLEGIHGVKINTLYSNMRSLGKGAFGQVMLV